jgi:8-oxo-dGTP pyrophosphatase MutT (NUDIX family)
MRFEPTTDKTSSRSVVLLKINTKEDDWKAKLPIKYYFYKKRNFRDDYHANIRVFNLIERKKYACIDTDNKEAYDFVITIMKKYNIDVKQNCYPSVSNYFHPTVKENSYKFHFWFQIDNSVNPLSHMHVNGMLLDIWCQDSKARLIYETNVTNMYLDDSKTYPLLSKEIYCDLLTTKKGIFGKNEVSTCMYHSTGCITTVPTNNSTNNHNSQEYYTVKLKNIDDIKNFKNIKNNLHEFKHEADGNVRVFNLADKKKYVCFDTDDKKSNEHVESIMKKYNIKDNCYPSISNYFYQNHGENRFKHHYWFEIEEAVSVTSHIHINNTLLDVWGPNGNYTRSNWIKFRNNCDNDSRRLIYEPNVEGMCLDTSKKYPKLTTEIYHAVMNINQHRDLFSNKKKTTSCIFHDNCIAFEQFKHEEEKDFKRIGYNPMSDYHLTLLKQYLSSSKNINSYAYICSDESYGVICCVKTNDSSDPLIAAIRMRKAPHYLALPKGHHTKKSENDIECAIRETREEIGIDVSKYIKPDLHTSEKYTIATPMRIETWKAHKDYPDESKRPFCVYYKEVKYFMAVLPKALQLKPQSEEILECNWVSLSTLKNEMHPDASKTLTQFFNCKNVSSNLTLSMFDNIKLNSFNIFKKKQQQSEITYNRNVIICDIDDTLLKNGIHPIQHTIDYVNSLNTDVVIVTGRELKQRKKTEKSLKNAGVRYSSLLMNPYSCKEISKWKAENAEKLKKVAILAIDNDPKHMAVYSNAGIKCIHPESLSHKPEIKKGLFDFLKKK